MKTIVTIVGARPQFIKLAPVSRAITDTARVNEVLIHTGQHFDVGMSDIFFSELGISPPEYNLEVQGGGHGAMTGAMLAKLEPILEGIRPDRVLVYGDTNSTLAGALVAAKLHIPIAHIEAGLRSFNRSMPEEINRIVTDHLSDMLFTATDAASNNLVREGFEKDQIVQVGDVMYDAALHVAGRAGQRSSILNSVGVTPGDYVLATIHRAENTDNVARLTNIVVALERVAEEIPVILPLHPRTANCMREAGLSFKNVCTLSPVGYLDMVALETHAAVIATDSGGVQKEAFFYEVPCVTLRDETEWVELVALGWNRLASPSESGLAEAILGAHGSRGEKAQPYGDGRAAQRIAEIIARS